MLLTFPLLASGQLVDSLDAYPVRWSLLSSDCDARILSHEHTRMPEAENASCESVTLKTGHGTQAILIYPIEPVRPIDDLTARLSVHALNRGMRIGLRVRFPHLISDRTRRPEQVFVFGASTSRVGEFQRIGVGNLRQPLQLKTIALRREFGSQADLRDAYVDAVVLNVYSGAGVHRIGLDLLAVDAMIPASSAPALRSRPDEPEPSGVTLRRPEQGTGPPFANRRLTRVLQYQGEPLAWLRSLGFDAIWTAATPDRDLLVDAMRNQMRVYCSPPDVADPELKPLLEPLAGWVVGAHMAVDSQTRLEIREQIQRVRRLPSWWQRPILINALEDERHYAAIADGLILDAPPLWQVNQAGESRAALQRRTAHLHQQPLAVTVPSGPPSTAIFQSQAIGNRIGSTSDGPFAWQGIWAQATDALAAGARSIWYRSSESLATGMPRDQCRALAMGFVNRHLMLIESHFDPMSQIEKLTGLRGDYVGVRVRTSDRSLLLVTSQRRLRSETDLPLAGASGTRVWTLSGDGDALTIPLAPEDRGKPVWRLTHFNATRLSSQNRTSAASVEIISPDMVETILISDDVRAGGMAATRGNQLVRQAASDRWQLARDQLAKARNDWAHVNNLRIITSPPPTALLNASGQAESDAEVFLRGGEPNEALRFASRADAWSLRALGMLGVSIHNRPGGSVWVSSPAWMSDNFETQMAWWPLISIPTGQGILRRLGVPISPHAGQWSRNLLAGGDLDRPESLDQGWDFGRRHPQWADSEARWVQRGAYQGPGAMELVAMPKTDDPLPGGYSGTVLLAQSPPVHLAADTAYRVDAMVKTMGFQQPHQGVLVYESGASQDLGVLVRDTDGWQTITLLRHATDSHPIRVCFELIGGGECTVDSIEVRQWQLSGNRPSTSAAGDSVLLSPIAKESTGRAR
ncbi:MAG: hypothetical protein AAGD07_12030 [Planctomycetota bacterium]